MVNILTDRGQGLCVPDCVISADRTSATGTDNGPRLAAAINAAIVLCPVGGSIRVVGPPGTYRISSEPIYDSFTGKVIIFDMPGAHWFVDENVPCFNFDCGYGEIKSLAANYTKGSTTLSVAAMATALKKNQPFKIVSNVVDPANRDSGSAADQYRIGEWAHAGAGSTTTSVVLARPLRFVEGKEPTSGVGDEATVDSYTITDNARIITLSGGSVRGDLGTIEYAEGHDTGAVWNA